jgi:hypothetical protein
MLRVMIAAMGILLACSILAADSLRHAWFTKASALAKPQSCEGCRDRRAAPICQRRGLGCTSDEQKKLLGERP